MTLFAALLSAIAVLPSDRMAMADRLFNRGEYVEARSEYAALEGENEMLMRWRKSDNAYDSMHAAGGGR
jgi:hypothetical protein